MSFLKKMVPFLPVCHVSNHLSLPDMFLGDFNPQLLDPHHHHHPVGCLGIPTVRFVSLENEELVQSRRPPGVDDVM